MSLTGIRDIDREILHRITDEEVLRVWMLDKRTYWETCDDGFLRRRLQNLEKYKSCNSNETWKKFFGRYVYYKREMKNIYNFEYKEGNFLKQYDILKRSKEVLVIAVLGEELSLVKYAVENGENIHMYNNMAFRTACEEGYLEIAKYLVEKGAKISEMDNYALRYASSNGRLEIVKWLVEEQEEEKEQGVDIHSRDDLSFRWACEKGHLEIAKYLVEKGCDIHILNDLAIVLAAENGHLPVVKWLTENGSSLSVEKNFLLRTSTLPEHRAIAEYLSNI